MASSAAVLVADAHAAMGRGAFQEAMELLERAGAIEDLAETHELLGTLAYADDRMDVVCDEWAQAFGGYRRDDRPCDAARVAARLSEVHWNILGRPGAGRGWLERAREVLEDVGPCVELGYLELALIACDRPDVDDLLASADRARRIAIEHGDVGLEVRALADGGLALISQGRIEEGFRRLDRALAALGEVDDGYIVGTTLCAMLSSCDRAGDVARAAELVGLTHARVLDRTDGRPRVLGTHCHVAYGGVLCTAGQWTEAERVIVQALGPEASVSRIHRAEAASRLAEIRVHQGRVEEAAELIAPYDGHVATGCPLALVHIARGEHPLAAAVLQRTVTQLVGDVSRGAPLLSLLIECQLALGDRAGASATSHRLDAIAADVEVGFVVALAEHGRALVALDAGDPATAIAELSRAQDRIGDTGRPLVDLRVLLDLARAHAAAGDPAAAADAARRAHASAVTIGAQAMRDRAAAILRQVGVPAPRPTTTHAALAGLTARELEVLDLIRRGETNQSIAAQLYLSPKTVEHHVGRMLAKLGVRSRAQAASIATAAFLAGSGDASGVSPM